MRGRVVPSRDVSEADWYGAGLNGFGGRVDQVVPSGYPAYARILHPATAETRDEVRWSEVADRSGTVLHALAQFPALAGRWQSDQREPHGWPGENPEEGTLTPQQLRVLCEILVHHTATPDRCWLTVWGGFGNLPEKWARTAPRVHQLHREYYLFERPLTEVFEFSAQVARIGWDLPSTDDSGPTWIQSPNEWWPQDRAWCVASEIDFHCTLVAGSEGLISDILAHPELEAFAVQPTDDLTFEGDAINPLPRSADE